MSRSRFQGTEVTIVTGAFSITSSEHIFTFTFMHLADAFIQSDLHCIQVTVSTFYQLLLSLGIEPMILALLRHALPVELQETHTQDTALTNSLTLTS